MTHLSDITVLKSLGPKLCKTWLPDGTIKSYDEAKQYTVEVVPVAGIHTLGTLVEDLAGHPTQCIIRGWPAKAIAPDETVVRRIGVFEDRPSHLFVIDVDNFDGTLDQFVATLPPCFQDITYVWQYSGSHGHPSKPGLRAHLFFWLDEPMTCEQAEAWSVEYLPGADRTVHRTVQVNYTASPLTNGPDPVAQRVGWVQGMLGDVVQIPLDLPVPHVSSAQRTKREDRKHLADPGLKRGVIGALCRAYTPRDLPTLFPDQFKAGARSKDRLTWLVGGGSAEGLRVTDSGTHIFNGHHTSPTGGRAVNLFDCVRTHVYGHLDAAVDADALALEPTGAPSYRATEAWALTLPAVQAQLVTPEAKKATEVARAAHAEQLISESDDAQQKLTNLMHLIDECSDLRKLEFEVGYRVAQSSAFTKTERSLIEQALHRKAMALAGSKLPIGVVRGWIAPAALGARILPDVSPDGTPRCTIENLATVLAGLGIAVRYNVISKRPEILGSALAFTTDNYASATVTYVASECAKIGMPHQFGVVNAFLLNLAEADIYNPVLTWLESAPWDNRSRLPALAATLTVRDGFSTELRDTMLRKWLIQAVALAASPYPIMARGALIVQGPQYLGKTRWLKSLVPGHEHLVSLGRTLDPSSKDSVRTFISSWLSEMGELDATFRRSDIAALKAFISQDVDTLRVPYAVNDSSYQRRTAAYGSVNEEEFLHDGTGNTRFWVVPVVAMDHEHGIDMQQLWAEVLALWRGGERHYFTPGEMAEVNLSSDQFAVSGPLDDKVASRFRWDLVEASDPEIVWSWRTATEVLSMLGITNPTSADHLKVGKALAKRSKRTSRVNNGVRRLHVPMLADEVGVEEMLG